MKSVGPGENAKGTGASQRCNLVAEATSHDRLEIYLTPVHILRYTAQRILRLLHLVRRHSRRPFVRLYLPPSSPAESDIRAGSVFPFSSLGVHDILLERGTAVVQASLGAKIRELEPGDHTALLFAVDSTGRSETLFSSSFAVDDADAEWLIPPQEITIRAGSALRFVLQRVEQQGLTTVYESQPLHIRVEQRALSHQYVFGRAGSRVLDVFVAAAAVSVLLLPFTVLALYIRRQVVRGFPEVAAERMKSFHSPLYRYFAPAFYRDPSRWIYRNNHLEQGPIYKLETLRPIGKRPLLGRASLLLRGWGVDELPQLLAILRGWWTVFGPRAVPNRDALLAPDGSTVQNSRDRHARYELGGKQRKPGALSLRLAMTPRGSIELPPWRTMLLYDRYDSSHWSATHAARVLVRLALSFVWGEALGEHHGPIKIRVAAPEQPPALSAAGQGSGDSSV